MEIPDPASVTPSTRNDGIKSSAHRTFDIPELLDLILSLAINPPGGELASVSIQFHEASIRHIWSGEKRCLDLEILLSLFPTDVFKPKQAMEKWVFLRQVNHSDWTRFKHYSTYVRSLTIECSSLTSSFLTTFNDTGKTIFPRLQKLFLRLDPDNRNQLFPILPDLQYLHIGDAAFDDSPDRREITAGLLQQLPHCAPRLTELGVGSLMGLRMDPVDTPNPNGDSVYSDVAYTSLRSLNSLTKLHLAIDEFATDPILGWIAGNPRLSVVRLEGIIFPVNLDNSTQSFPSLQKLSISGTDVGAKSLLRFSTLASLEDLHLFLTPPAGYTNPLRIDSIRLFQQAAHLTRIRIWIEPYKSRTPRASLSWSDIQPLLACKKVVKFLLWLNMPMEGLDDAAIEELAGSWKDLKSTTINNSLCTTAVTLRALGTLALQCPGLRSVQIYQVSFRGSHKPHIPQSYQTTTNQGGPHRTPISREFRLVFHKVLWGRRSDLDYSGPPETIACILHDLWPGLKSENVRQHYLDPTTFEKAAWEALVGFLDERDSFREKDEAHPFRLLTNATENPTPAV